LDIETYRIKCCSWFCGSNQWNVILTNVNRVNLVDYHSMKFAPEMRRISVAVIIPYNAAISQAFRLFPRLFIKTAERYGRV